MNCWGCSIEIKEIKGRQKYPVGERKGKHHICDACKKKFLADGQLQKIDAPSYADIFNMNIGYIKFLLEKSMFTHKNLKNISHSGQYIEQELRLIVNDILPERFKVVHGYIISAQDNKSAPLISPQIDMIIVDTLVPHTIYSIDKANGMTVVPIESVAAFFEIKRTLDKNSLAEAIKHIEKICSSVKINKTSLNRFLPGGIPIQISGGYMSNPMIGIIGLTHKRELEDYDLSKNTQYKEIINRISQKSTLDYIASIDGFLAIAIAIKGDKKIMHIPDARDPSWQYCSMVFSRKNVNHSYIIARIFGEILFYVSNFCGRKINIDHYFSNFELMKNN